MPGCAVQVAGAQAESRSLPILGNERMECGNAEWLENGGTGGRRISQQMDLQVEMS